MSGFEVLGVVLGTIPLVISALEHYQEGLHTIRRWRSYEAELNSLKRILGTENAIFNNTCRQLLIGIVNSVEHEKLVDEPFGVLWSNPEIRDRIALRLDQGYESFRATVVSMDVTLREIKTKLGLDEQGQIKWTEGKAIAKEIKRATFTIKRSHFDDLLATISKNNQDLKTLTNQSIKLEPGIRVTHHGRLFSQLNEAIRSIYWAMRYSLVCSCADSHQVSLRLAKPKLKPRNEDSQILRNSNFQCAVSYHIDSQQTSRDKEEWSLMVLRLYDPPSRPPEAVQPKTLSPQESLTPSSTTSTSSINMNQLVKRLQRVRFSEEVISSSEKTSLLYSVKTVITTSLPTATAFVTPGGTLSTATVQDEHLEDPINLCKLVRKGKAGMASECYGLVSNNTSQRYAKFGVYSHSERRNSTTMVSLRTILEGGGESHFPTTSYAERLKLAVDISSGALQLIHTSWLPERITSRDIMFPMQDGRPVYGQPFLAKAFSDPEQQQPVAAQASHPQTMRKILFSVGILLLEIFLSETLDHVWDANIAKSTPEAMSQFSDRKAAVALLNEVQTLGSLNFYSAVRRFLLCEFLCLDATSGDQGFYKEVYGKAIALIEEDFKLSQAL